MSLEGSECNVLDREIRNVWMLETLLSWIQAFYFTFPDFNQNLKRCEFRGASDSFKEAVGLIQRVQSGTLGPQRFPEFKQPRLFNKFLIWSFYYEPDGTHISWTHTEKKECMWRQSYAAQQQRSYSLHCGTHSAATMLPRGRAAVGLHRTFTRLRTAAATENRCDSVKLTAS